jgi:aldose 1-epimerase
MTYNLIANNGPHCIHGGEVGFDRRVWRLGDREVGVDYAQVAFEISSPDGDEGFPGQLTIHVTYRLCADGALGIAYRATTTRSTVLNLTNHAYFNLQGEGAGSILDHVFQINADRYLEIDETVLPTGRISSVAGTPLDFRSPKRMGDGVRADHPQIRFGRGYDHCFALWPTARDRLHVAARVFDPASGRTLRVETTEPGLQLNSGNVLSGRFCGDSGRTYRQSDGFCLEAQHYPDAPNQPHFPSTVLKPRDVYRAQTMYHLGVLDEEW